MIKNHTSIFIDKNPYKNLFSKIYNEFLFLLSLLRLFEEWIHKTYENYYAWDIGYEFVDVGIENIPEKD